MVYRKHDANGLPVPTKQELKHWTKGQVEGIELSYPQIVTMFKIRSITLQRFHYFYLYCHNHCNLRTVTEKELETIAVTLFHCSQRTAFDYSRCLKGILDWTT